MNSLLPSPIKNELVSILIKNKEKEFRCHVQFVHSIGLELAKRFKGDSIVVEISCLLHDIGRDEELLGEEHEQASARLSKDIIKNFNIPDKKKEQIIQCIGNHNAEISLESIEECILISADASSKLLYHESFMLMCKKETYLEKREWAMKYVEKGYRKIQIDEFKKEMEPRYTQLKDMYDKVINIT